MGLTVFSFVLFPLSLIWFASPNRLLQLAILASIFEAAAAIVFGGLGVQPALVPACMFLAYFTLQVLLGAKLPGTSKVMDVMWPFLLVTLWALLSSYIMPRWFEGRVQVWPQKQLPPFTTAALAPTSSNLNQDVYLLLNSILLVMAALYLTKSGLKLIGFLHCYFASGFLVAAVSLWQFASKVAGVPYPSEILYSNPGWAILTAQTIGRVPRINGPFAEPSALASFMASIVCATGWIMLCGRADAMTKLLFVTGLLTMMLSTSTTGFAVLALVGGGVLVYAVLSGSFYMMSRIAKISAPLALVFVLLSLGASAFVPGFNKNVSEVMDATLNKQGSSSYNDRTGADLDSLQAGLDTYGLGVGWGSNRSSSLVPGLVASLGLPGVVGLLLFGFKVTAEVSAMRRLRASVESMIVINGCCGGLVGFLMAALVSAPTITTPTFYLLLALLIGCTTRVRLDRRQLHQEPIPTHGFSAMAAG